MYKIETLDNHLTILKIPMPGVESIATVVMVKAGSRYEAETDFGVAHFLEHMVFKGTTKYPTNKILTQKVDGIGAVFNAFTGEEMTAFYLRAAAKDLDLTLDVLSQLTTQALLEPDEINRERGVILEEKHMYEDQPNAFNAQEFTKMMFAGSGLGHDIVGTDDSICGIQRDNFCRFIESWYRPHNMLVVIAGKKETIEAPDINQKVARYFQFADLATPAPRQEDFWEQSFTYGGHVNIIDRKTEQTHFVLGWPSIDRFDRRDAVLGLLQTILGGNMSSRLFSEVRERRGLCYYVYAQDDAYCDSGFFGAASGVNPGTLTEAIKVTVDQFTALASGDKPVTPEELRRAQDYRCGQMTLAAESVYNLALNYGSQYLFEHKIRTVADEMERIQAVSLDEIQALAKELIQPGQLRLSVIGQLTKSQRQDLAKMIA